MLYFSTLIFTIYTYTYINFATWSAVVAQGSWVLSPQGRNFNSPLRIGRITGQTSIASFCYKIYLGWTQIPPQYTWYILILRATRPSHGDVEPGDCHEAFDKSWLILAMNFSFASQHLCHTTMQHLYTHTYPRYILMRTDTHHPAMVQIYPQVKWRPNVQRAEWVVIYN